MMNDKSLVSLPFYQKSGSFDVSNDHKLFDYFFGCVSFVDEAVNWPSGLISLELHFLVFKDIEYYSLLSMSPSNLCQVE